MQKLLISLSLLLAILGCKTRPKGGGLVEDPTPSPSSANVEETKVQQIKGLYLTLANQLQSSSNPDALSLASMATDAANTPDDQMQAYLDSGHPSTVSAELSSEQKNGQETPAFLSDKNTQIAAIAMITLSSIAIVSSISPKPLLGRGSNVATLAVSIAGLVLGTNLLRNSGDPRAEDKAKKLALSAGVIALVFGVANIGLEAVKKLPAYKAGVQRGVSQIQELTAQQVKEFRAAGNEAVAKKIELEMPKRLEAIESKTRVKTGNVIWAAATIAIGTGFIVASQTAFNLADEPQTPQQTLAKINQLMTSK